MRIRITPKSKPELDYFNFYAIAVLESLGNTMPTQGEIDDTETLLRTIFQKLTHVEAQSYLLKHRAH